MLSSRFRCVGILLVLLYTVGFSGLHIPIPTPEADKQNELMVSHTIFLLDKDASYVSVNTGPTECILREDASESEKEEFARCIAESGCSNWKQHRDSTNGDTSMICSDIPDISVKMEPTECVIQGDASESEKEEFARCIAKSGCSNWKQHRDIKNDNTSMICKEQ